MKKRLLSQLFEPTATSLQIVPSLLSILTRFRLGQTKDADASLFTFSPLSCQCPIRTPASQRLCKHSPSSKQHGRPHRLTSPRLTVAGSTATLCDPALSTPTDRPPPPAQPPHPPAAASVITQHKPALSSTASFRAPGRLTSDCTQKALHTAHPGGR